MNLLALSFAILLALNPYDAVAQQIEPSREDYKMLAQVYEHRALSGDAQAAYDLGFLYNSGRGVTKDLPTAFQWYLEAAKGGLLAGQEKVSSFYYVGVGTIKSDEQAYLWLLIAQYNGGQNLSSQMIRLETALTPEARIRAQENAQLCVSSGYSDC